MSNTTSIDTLLAITALALVSGVGVAVYRAGNASGGLLGAFELRGEWWIDTDGQALYADGDVGDMNHEAHVIEGLTSSILNAFDISVDTEHLGTLDNYKDELHGAEVSPNEDVLFNSEELKARWPDNIQRRMAIRCALGIDDAREYALQFDGWKRVKGNNIQTWTLTSNDLRDIANGLNSADDEIPDDALFNIEVSSNNKFYQDVPMHVIQRGSPGALREYLFAGW